MQHSPKKYYISHLRLENRIGKLIYTPLFRTREKENSRKKTYRHKLKHGWQVKTQTIKELNSWKLLESRK